MKHNIFIINCSLILCKSATFVNLIYAKWKYTHMNNKIIFLLFIFFSFILSTSHQRFLNFLCLFEVRDKVKCTRFYPFRMQKQEMETNLIKLWSQSLLPFNIRLLMFLCYYYPQTFNHLSGLSLLLPLNRKCLKVSFTSSKIILKKKSRLWN